MPQPQLRRHIAYCALSLLFADLPEAAAQTRYVSAYNTLVRNLNARTALGPLGTTRPLKDTARGDTVTQADLHDLRSAVMSLMQSGSFVDAGLVTASPETFAAAYPTGSSAYASSIMGGVGDGQGRWTKVPGPYCESGATLYSASFLDPPSLWVHIQELDKAIRALRFSTLPLGTPCVWTNNGEANVRGGWANNATNWGRAARDAETSYAVTPPSASTRAAPAAYSHGHGSRTGFPNEAYLEHRYAYCEVSLLSTQVPHRLYFYAYAQKMPAEPPWPTRSLFSTHGDPLLENKWVQWHTSEVSSSNTVCSSALGGLARPAWCPEPAAGGEATFLGYTVSGTRVVVEWFFNDDTLVAPPENDDDEDDGLVDVGCACTTCLPEAEPVWIAMSTGTRVRIPMGVSNGNAYGGLRVKAYFTEYTDGGRTQQVFSLDTSAEPWTSNTSEGWEFALLKRPSGAEMYCSLKGPAAGQPVGRPRSYRLTRSGLDYTLTFPASPKLVRHQFWGGRLMRVRAMLGQTDIVLDTSGIRGNWPGLSVQYVDGSFRSPVKAVDSPLVYAIVGATVDGLIRNVEYRWKVPAQTNRVSYYRGSRGFQTLDGAGRVLRDTRLVDDASNGGVEVWHGITTNVGVCAARKERRDDVYEPTNGWRLLKETVSACTGSRTTDVRSVTTTLQPFDWGWEPVERTVAQGTACAQVTRWSYYTNATATGCYSRVRLAEMPDGDWRLYDYDVAGRETRVLSPFKDAMPGQTTDVRETETVYAGDPRLAALGMTATNAPALDDRPRLVIERLLGREASRTYYAIGDDRETVVQCAAPGARYDAASNLVTTTRSYTNGTFAGRSARIDRPDGTFTLYSYAFDGARLTTTESSGSGNATTVTNGIRRVTVTDAAGHTTSETVTDIASGLLIGGTAYTLDSYGRVTLASNTVQGTSTRTEYGCCGPETVTDPDGIVTRYAYDELKRPFAVERAGVTTYTTYDAGDTPLEQRQTAAGIEDRVNRETHDALGRVTMREDPTGAQTFCDYATNATGGRVVTVTLPGGHTRVEDYYRDGELRSVTGTAVHAVSYDYGIDAQGVYRTEYHGPDTNATEWIRTRTDNLGRVWRTEYPDGSARTLSYDAAGRLVMESDGAVTQITEYDDRGERFRGGIDMDGSGRLEPDGADRIQEASVGYALLNGRTTRIAMQRLAAVAGTNALLTLREERQSADGTNLWSIAFGRTTRVDVVRQPASVTRMETTTFPDGTRQITAYSNGLPVSVEQRDTTGGLVAASTTLRDVFGQPIRVTDTAPDGTSRRQTFGYDAGGRVTNEVMTAGPLRQEKRYRYNAQGQLIETTAPDGGVITFGYTPYGELEWQAGARTYPVRYAYDDRGRMIGLYTYRQGTNGTADLTQWRYDPMKGQLLRKVYADGTTVNYEYDAAGRLSLRTTARGVQARYGYDPAGSPTNIAYSDGTPDVRFSYDRQGRPEIVTDALGAHTNRYASDGQLLSQSLPHAALSTSLAYDALGRRTGLVIRTTAGMTAGNTAYAFDTAGRLSMVSGSGGTAQYTYAPDGRSVAGLTVPGRKPETLAASWQYDPAGRVTSVLWQANGTTWLGLAQAYNETGSLQSRAGPAQQAWTYEYDDLGQVASARQTAPTNRTFTYAYDTIGNRTATTRPDGRNTVYLANVLNQYTRLESLDFASGGFRGTVYAFGGGGGPTLQAAAQAASAPTLVPRQTALSYDADGNLTNDGTRAYAWDAENRLLSVTPLVLTAGATRVRCAYDYLSRRAWRAIDTWDGEGWSWVGTNRFAYDGWHTVAETCERPGAITTNVYVWGLDLSGTVGGAGGIGGLLFGRLNDTGTATAIAYACDTVGNIIGLLDISNGQAVAEYEYEPFGAMSTSRLYTVVARQNAFFFNSKYTDSDPTLAYYGYRYFSPSLGRWISRDPLAEAGGLNLQAAFGNSPMTLVDPNGLVNIVVSGTDGDRLMSRGYTSDAPTTDYLDYAGRYYFKQIGDGVWDFESVGSFMTPLAFARKGWNFPVTAPAAIAHSAMSLDPSYLRNLLIPNSFRVDVEINGGRVADLIAGSTDETDVLLAHSQGVTLAAAGVEGASRRKTVSCCKRIKMVLLAPKIQASYLRRLIKAAAHNQPRWRIEVLVIGSKNDNLIPCGTENGYIAHLGFGARRFIALNPENRCRFQPPIGVTHLLGFPLEKPTQEWVTYIIDTGQGSAHDSRKHTGVQPLPGDDYGFEVINTPQAERVRQVIKSFIAR